jgi:hypothetical protein
VHVDSLFYLSSLFLFRSSASGRRHPSQHRSHLRVFGCVPGFRTSSLAAATTRDRGRLSLIAAGRQEVLGVSGDPDVAQQRVQVHLVRGQGRQQRTRIHQLFDPMALGPVRRLKEIPAVSPPW